MINKLTLYSNIINEARKKFDIIKEQFEVVNEERKKNFVVILNKLEKRIKNIGKSSRAFIKRKEELINCFLSGNNIQFIMTSWKYIRPLFSLWSDTSEEYLQKRLPDQSLLQHIVYLVNTKEKPYLGMLALRELCHLFFLRYSCLKDVRTCFGNFVRDQLEKNPNLSENFGLGKLKVYAQFIFSATAHKWIVQESQKRNESLISVANYFEISSNSELFYEAMCLYYLEELKKLRPNEDAPILYELLKPTVYNIPYDETSNLGHNAIKILIDILQKHNATLEPPIWKNFIFKIAGDPRVPTYSANYRMWWSIIGSGRTEFIRRLLSKFDMKLFLRIIKEYSEDNDDMSRMFPKRKKFLEYIFENNDISYTHLFLGTDAAHFVDEFFIDQEKPYYTNILGSNRSLTIFYYKVGAAHVIEGSHNFSMRILDNLPDNSKINEYEKYIDVKEFNSTLDTLYENQFKTYNIEKIRHDKNGKWIIKAINILKLQYNIMIEEDKVLDYSDFIKYCKGS